MALEQKQGFQKIEEKLRAASVFLKPYEEENEDDIRLFATIPRVFKFGDPQNPSSLPDLPANYAQSNFATVYSPFLRRTDDFSKVDEKALQDEITNSQNRKEFVDKRKQWIDFYSGHQSDYYCFAKCCPGLYSWFRRNCSCAPCNKGQPPPPDYPMPQSVNCCCCCCPCGDLDSHSSTYLADMQTKYYVWADKSYPGYPPHIDNVPNWEKYNVVALFNWSGLVQQLESSFDKKSSKRHTSMKEFSSSMTKFFPDNLGPMYAAIQPNTWWNDATFGMLRMQGPNPVWIQRVTAIPAKFQVDMKVVGLNGNMDANEELKKGRMYMIDYSILDGLSNVNVDQMAPAAMCLLHYDNNIHQIRPVAIQLEQKLSPGNGVYYRDMKADPERDWQWRYAKSAVNAAEWNTHEIGVHLTSAHLVEEVLCMCTHRQLPPHHAVYGLTVPHYEKTLSLNVLARSALVPTIVAIGGLPTNDAVQQLVHRYYYDFYDFQKTYVPNDLKARGFVDSKSNTLKQMLNDVQTNTPSYLYATDALRLWDATRTFVSAVLKKYYPGGDNEVALDQYLANWVAEIKQKQVGNFPTITTIEQLTDAVTCIIYNGSVLHSAVNYLQWYYMGYVPLIPGNILGPLPSKDTTIDETYLASHLPTIYQEELSRAIAGTLSSPSELPLPSLNAEYLPSYAEPALLAFKNQLYNLHLLSEKRDAWLAKLGRETYPILDPDQVANSIQI